jgi:uncharacterized protein (DUF2342 family)
MRKMVGSGMVNSDAAAKIGLSELRAVAITPSDHLTKHQAQITVRSAHRLMTRPNQHATGRLIALIARPTGKWFALGTMAV